ncbi:MAG: type II secretion system F family protein [Acidobacteriota bacterium]
MPEFHCKLGTTTGELIERTYTADTLEGLRADLERRDYLVLKIRRRSNLLKILWPFGGGRGRIKPREFLIFNKELEALIRAGLPIMACLDLLIERRKNPVFRKALTEIRDQVRSGSSLSEAFENQQGLVPRMYSSSLASGERSGDVAGVLRRYVAYTKTLLDLRKKVANALVYPMVILVMACGMMVVLFYWVLPQFSEFYKDFGAELPFITKALMGVADFLQDHSLVIFLVAFGCLIALGSALNTRAGRMRVDQAKLVVPFMGKIWNKYCVSRFTRTLGTLISGGIPLVTAIEISAQAVGNLVFQTRLESVSRQVREGESLWASLEKTRLFPDIVVEMVKVGESTGSLEEMLENVSAFYDEEIDDNLGTMVTLMEPILLVTMGMIVAGVLLAIYLPLIRSYSATQSF